MSDENKEYPDNDIYSNRKKKVDEFKINIDTQGPSEHSEDGFTETSDDINSFSTSNGNGQEQSNKYDYTITEADKQRMKEKSKRNKWTFRLIWISVIVIISIIASKYILVGINDMLSIRGSSEVVSIEIPKNATLTQVTDILVDNGIIENRSFFKVYATITKASKRFIHGKFDLRKDMDYEAIINYLQTNSNRTDTVNVTFLEGMNVNQYAQLLEKNGVCNADEFLQVCNSNNFDDDYEFIKSINNTSDRYYKLEGYLFPDTYTFYVDETPENVIQRLLINYNKKISQKIELSGYSSKISIQDAAKNKGMSMNDLLIVASLIQAESANEDDMYKVSSVIHNRLKTLGTGGRNSAGEYGLQRLMIDSTVWYPYRKKADVPNDIVNTFKSRYDTYNIDGLPAGAICNPGLKAIIAALTPSSTNYYYFCHSQNGTAYYAQSLVVHNQNLVKAGLA